MNRWKGLSDIRRDYGQLSLNEGEVKASPIAQFEDWFMEVLKVEKQDPTAMVLSTVDELGHPDSRVVLLKAIHDDSFIFYTNYESTKSLQISNTPYVALNFYWPEMARQVRIRGTVKRTSKAQSDEYFSSRPVASQLSAIVSPQSRKVDTRDELESRLNELIAEFQQPIIRPKHWGGYAVFPQEMEFWQGRDNRLHDRIHYFQENNKNSLFISSPT